MKDDHLQGILFPSVLRGQSVKASTSQRLLRRARGLAGHFAATSRPAQLPSLQRDTELGDFIDRADLHDLLSRLRR